MITCLSTTIATCLKVYAHCNEQSSTPNGKTCYEDNHHVHGTAVSVMARMRMYIYILGSAHEITLPPASLKVDVVGCGYSKPVPIASVGAKGGRIRGGGLDLVRAHSTPSSPHRLRGCTSIKISQHIQVQSLLTKHLLTTSSLSSSHFCQNLSHPRTQNGCSLPSKRAQSMKKDAISSSTT